MSNVPDDWGCYYQRCSLCGARYHASEGWCSCTDSLDPCPCGDCAWVLDGEEVMCEECGGHPGDEFEDCDCGMNEWRVDTDGSTVCRYCCGKPGEELEDQDD